MKKSFLSSQLLSMPIDFLLFITILPIAYAPFTYLRMNPEYSESVWNIVALLVTAFGWVILYLSTKNIKSSSDISGIIFIVLILFVFIYLKDFIRAIVPADTQVYKYMIKRYIVSSIIFLLLKVVTESFLYNLGYDFIFSRAEFLREKLNIE